MPVTSLVILVSVVLVVSCGQTDRITEADQRYTQATTVGVSNDLQLQIRNRNRNHCELCIKRTVTDSRSPYALKRRVSKYK